MNWDSIGKAIKKRRLEKRFTQEELARRAGTTRQTISKIERGKAALVSMAILGRILDVLDLELQLKPAVKERKELWTPKELLED